MISYSKLHSFNSSDIKNIPARDLYDVLNKLSNLHGLSYGRTGQIMQVKGLGKDQYASNIYIDDIPFTNFISGISNLSTLPLDRIDNIIIDDSPVNNSSVSIYIYTKNYEINKPVTEMIYRDAFFNHRNISMNLGQRFSKNSSFLLFADITDYMDYRESSDFNFKYPYQRQNYNLSIELPNISFLKPTFEFSYLKENIYDLSVDSALYKPETLRWLLNFNSDVSRNIDNKLSFANSIKYDLIDPENKNYMIYDQFTYKDSTSLFKLNSKLEFFSFKNYRGESLFSLEPSYQKDFNSLKTNFYSYIKYSDLTDLTYSTSVNLIKQLPWGLEAYSLHSIYGGSYRILNDIIDVEFFKNEFYLENIFQFYSFSGSIYSGIDILEYQKNSSDTFSGNLTSGIHRYSKSKLDLKILKNLSLNLEYSHRLSLKTSINNPNSTAITSLNFTDRYFNDNFQISATVLHKYSDYYITENNREIINNLGINLRAKIVDVEIFFGIDNIMKNKYDINNNTYILNEHYGYQTIEGYDMQRFDEIWGVRWIFRY
ncbi:MAG: Plug domain-containing protein [Candidatus Delongbacteria bacterium]|nr:Plug domain-containing protein [Candidatus Delongbacteria bacterium]